MPTAIESLIKERIHAFVAELDLLVRKSTLEALQGVLASGMTQAPRARAAATRGPGRPRGSGRSSANLEEASAKVLAHVQGNDGQGIGAIAGATGLDLKVAKKAAAALLSAGQLKKSGQKRGTVYHLGSGKASSAPKARGGKRGKGRGRKAKAA